jgi:hypothetical protein
MVLLNRMLGRQVFAVPHDGHDRHNTHRPDANHNWYRRYNRNKCNPQVRGGRVYAIAQLRQSGRDCLTGKV